jgi:hypothetical protein
MRHFDIRKAIREGEEGHAGPLPGILLGAVGAVLLGIGAAGDDLGWLAIAGGILLALGFVAAFLMNHILVEYDIYARLEEMEKK